MKNTLKGKTKQTTEEWKEEYPLYMFDDVARKELVSFIKRLLNKEFIRGYDYGRRSALAEQEFEEQYGS